MTQGVETGEVKFYDARGKDFGFLYVLDDSGERTGEEVFFHYSTGRGVVVSHQGVEFGSPTVESHGIVHALQVPKEGERLVFERVAGRNVPKARLWAYASSWQQCEDQFAQRPVYRVRKVSAQQGESTESIVWEGQDVLALSAKYPRYDDKWAYDALCNSPTGSGETSTQQVLILETQQGGSWTKCDDVRVTACCVPKEAWNTHGSGNRRSRCQHGN